MDKKIKIAIAAGSACLAAIAVGLGVWQPWKTEPPVEPDTPPQETQKPQEEQLFVTVGGKKLPCTLYEQDGWSIYLPLDWTMEGGVMWPDRAKMPDARLSIIPWDQPDAYPLSFSSVYPTDNGFGRTYYASVGTDRYEISFRSRMGDWDSYSRIFEALTRTFAVGKTPVFTSIRSAAEPDMHYENGDAILFLDKNGIPLNDEAEKAIRDRMLTWTPEERTAYTGSYDLDGALDWAASYTLDAEHYWDVFSATAAYALNADGGKPKTEPFLLALLHDGEEVKEIRPIWEPSREKLPGSVDFLPLLTQPAIRALSLNELMDMAAWFNLPENNGLLRFPYSRGSDPEQITPSLYVLFHDLSDGVPSQEEMDALEAAGVSPELDIGRLPRAYMASYLETKLGMSADQAEKTLNQELAGSVSEETMTTGLGVYLRAYDTWYMSRSDTMMGSYVFTEGTVDPSGRCVITYTNPCFYLTGGSELDTLFDRTAEAAIVPAPGAPGQWIVESNKIVG